MQWLLTTNRLWQDGQTTTTAAQRRVIRYFIGYDLNVGFRDLILLQDCDLAIDAEHICHFGLKRLVAPLEIVANLVWLDLVATEDFAHRALCDAGQAGVPGSLGVRADVACQQPGGPEFVRIALLLGSLAGQRHQPGFGFVGDLRSLAKPRAVADRRHHAKPDGAVQTALDSLVGHTDGLAHRVARGVGAIREQDSAGAVRDRAIASSSASSSSWNRISMTRRGAAIVPCHRCGMPDDKI